MKDPISVTRVNASHPMVIPPFTKFLDRIEDELNRIFRVVQAGRTFQQQDSIYQEGRTTPGPNVRPGHPLGDVVTWAPAGWSYHCYFVAIDVAPFKIGSTTELDWAFDYSTIRQAAIDNGIECGMDWKSPKTDKDHFQITFGLSEQQMYHKYTIKDFIPGTQFINIP